ncbi:MAG: hypothetical protein RQ757_07315 [Pseudomonadales bacterium]|nr:hypothetical protein [Pseudomonadales bacterium]
MLGITGYLTAWGIYLAAGLVCYLLFYRLTSFISYKPLANSLRAILLALMFTPWYVAPDQDLMAPALMVMLLDLISHGGTAFVRALVPLVLALILALIIALTGGMLKRFIFKKRQQKG